MRCDKYVVKMDGHVFVLLNYRHLLAFELLKGSKS